MVYNNKRYSKHISFVSRSLGRSCLESHFIPRCSQCKRQAVSKVILNRWKHPNERVPSAITNWISTLFVFTNIKTFKRKTHFKILFTKFAKIVETPWTWKIATLIHLTKTDDSFYFVVAYKLPKIIYGVWFWALSRNERFAIKFDIACIDIFSCW